VWRLVSLRGAIKLTHRTRIPHIPHTLSLIKNKWVAVSDDDTCDFHAHTWSEVSVHCNYAMDNGIVVQFVA